MEEEKRYFDVKDFLTFLILLEDNKPESVFTESIEDGTVEEYTFMRMSFKDNNIILYENPSYGIGIIQDTIMNPWKDSAELVFEDLECCGEYKVFI